MAQLLLILLGALAVLVPGFFVASLFLPGRVKVTRTRVIPAPPGLVFEQVNVLRNWERWSPWQRLDPAMQLTYTAKESGEGAGYTWKSRQRKAGSGSLHITTSRPASYIALEMRFMDHAPAKGCFRFEPAAGGTLVTWTLEAALGQRPDRKLMGLLMDKWVGRDFERGLENLERVLQSS